METMMKLPTFAPATKNNHPFFDNVPVMSPLAEQAAHKGFCPRCHTKTLERGYSGDGMVFHHCKTCQDIVVLSANAEVKGGRDERN